MTQYAWIDQIFEARIVKEGGSVRRHIADADRLGGGLENFLDEVEKRGFHVVQVGDQLVVLCNRGDIHILR
jgi:hypothetical protein